MQEYKNMSRQTAQFVLFHDRRLYIYIYIYIYIYTIYTYIYTYIYIYTCIYIYRQIDRQRARQIDRQIERQIDICIYIYIYTKLYGPFLWMSVTASRLYRTTTRRHCTFYQKFLLLIQINIGKMKGLDDLKAITIQTDSVMTLNCELFQSEFSVLSCRLIKNIFPLHIYRPNDYTIEIIVLLHLPGQLCVTTSSGF